MPETDQQIKEVGVSKQHRITEEQLSQTTKDLTDITLPFTVEGVTLMSPGTWNGKQYRPKEIKAAYQRSNFNDPEVKSLFNEHDDDDSRDWIGEIKNVRMQGKSMVGDVEIVTADEARKLAYGARFGISPKVTGIDQGDVMRKYNYDNFSLVYDPAVKTTYMNSEKQDTDESEQGVKNVKVKSTMSEQDQTEELSEDELQKIQEVTETVENSDVEELANIVAPFIGRDASEVQPHVEEVIENSYDKEDMSGHKSEEEMRDMEEIARQAAEDVASEMMEEKMMNEDDNVEDEGGDEADEAEQSLSVDEVAEKVAEEISIENSEDGDEEEDEGDDSDEAVESLKDEVKELKEQLSEDEDENQEEKTPNPGSQATGTSEELSAEEKVSQMDSKELDKGAAKYLLRQQGRSL